MAAYPFFIAYLYCSTCIDTVDKRYFDRAMHRNFTMGDFHFLIPFL